MQTELATEYLADHAKASIFEEPVLALSVTSRLARHRLKADVQNVKSL